jgi:hypothetical protein
MYSVQFSRRLQVKPTHRISDLLRDNSHGLDDQIKSDSPFRFFFMMIRNGIRLKNTNHKLYILRNLTSSDLKNCAASKFDSSSIIDNMSVQHLTTRDITGSSRNPSSITRTKLRHELLFSLG